MPFNNLREPVAGGVQSYNLNGTEYYTTVVDYFSKLLENINMIGSQSITSYSGTFTPAVATASNSVLITATTVYLEPVTLSSTLVQKTLTTPVNGGIIHVVANAQMSNTVAQTGVLPALGIRVEWFNPKAGVSGDWQNVGAYSNYQTFFSNVGGTGSGVLLPVSFYTMIPDTLPLAQYRITLLAGVFATGSVAFPHTGQWTVDANSPNGFQFHAWVGG